MALLEKLEAPFLVKRPVILAGVIAALVAMVISSEKRCRVSLENKVFLLKGAVSEEWSSCCCRRGLLLTVLLEVADFYSLLEYATV